MEETEQSESDGQGGIIFHRGHLIQGENQTVEGGLTLVFPKNGKRYAVLQNTGPLQFCLCLYKDQKTFLKRADRKNCRVHKLRFTANIKIHSLEMMMGRSRKPQNIFIIVHGGMPQYFKPTSEVEMRDWVSGFQKVANAIARRPMIDSSPRSSSEDETQDTNRQNRPKRPDQDSGVDLTSHTPRGSTLSTGQAERRESGGAGEAEGACDGAGGGGVEGVGGKERHPPEESSPISILPQVIEIDIPDEECSGLESRPSDVHDKEGPFRRSRMVLNNDRYEEQFVDVKPKIPPKMRSAFQSLEEERDKPEPKPRTLKSIEEIRNNIVTMRVSTWPNRPDSGGTDPAKDPNYSKLVLKTERQPSEPEGVCVELESNQPLSPKRNNSVGTWKTMGIKEVLEKQFNNEKPMKSMSPKRLRKKLMKCSRPTRVSGVIDDDCDDGDTIEESTLPIEDPECDPPYDRLTKYRKDRYRKDDAGEDAEGLDDVNDAVDDEDKRSSGESLHEHSDRKRFLSGSSQIGRRPLPKPNQEMDWKNVGNMVYEQSCRSCNVSVTKSDIKNALVLVKVQAEVMIAGWKKEVSEKLHGKFHVGDVILQANDIIVEQNGPEFVHALINSSAKSEIPFVIRRLPHASIKELNKTDEQTSWGLDTHKNEIKGVSGPALAGGIAPKTPAVFSNKQCDWIITELAHQRIPIAKCAQDEVKQRLEDLSNDNNLVLIIQPRDLIMELKEGLRRTKNPSDYYV